MKGREHIRDTEKRARYFLILAFVLLALGILVTGFVYYQNYEREYRTTVENRITAIADLKAGQLVQWKTERFGDAGIFHHNPAFSSLVQQYFRNPADAKTAGEVQDWLMREQAYAQYDSVCLLDTSGQIRLAVPETRVPVSPSVIEKIPGTFESDTITLVDFSRNEYDTKIYLTILVPLYENGEGRQPLGIVAFRIDPSHYLYPFINTWPEPSESAETLIIRRDGNEAVYLNNIRFSPDSALTLRVPVQRTELPAVQAVLGTEGTIDGTDYRGQQVISHIRGIPGTPWFLVAKIDAAEVYRPLRERLATLILIVLGLLIATGAGIGMIWRGQSTRFYRGLYEAETEILKEQVRSQSYLDIVGTIVIVIEADQTVSLVNPAGCRLLGHHQNEILGKNWFDTFVPERQREEGRETFAGVVSASSGPLDQNESIVLTSAGTERLVSWHTAVIRDTSRKITGILYSGEDITDRRRMEHDLEQKHEELNASYEQLAASEEELKSQFDALADSEKVIRSSEGRLLMAQEISRTGCWEYSFETRTLWSSAEANRIYGFPAAAGYHNPEEIEACIEDRERVRKAFSDFIRGRRDYDMEMTINPRDGSPKRVVHSLARIENDPNGRPTRVAGVIQDITDRKLAENSLQRINQKLAVISQLTWKDMTNQLFVLRSYLEVTKKHAAGQELILEDIRKCQRAVEAVNTITDFTRDYHDLGAKPPKWQNVKTSFLFGLSHITTGSIRHSLETGDLEIFADPQLEKACQGLFENSITHGEHVSCIRVFHRITPDGATLIYEDDGIGVPENRKDEIFLRGEGGHARVRGLFFVREILDITGITIRETGEPGKGVRFELSIPKGCYRWNPDNGNDQETGP